MFLAFACISRPKNDALCGLNSNLSNVLNETTNWTITFDCSRVSAKNTQPIGHFTFWKGNGFRAILQNNNLLIRTNNAFFQCFLEQKWAMLITDVPDCSVMSVRFDVIDILVYSQNTASNFQNIADSLFLFSGFPKRLGGTDSLKIAFDNFTRRPKSISIFRSSSGRVILDSYVATELQAPDTSIMNEGFLTNLAELVAKCDTSELSHFLGLERVQLVGHEQSRKSLNGGHTNIVR